jgi:hypothetical protein
MKGPSMGTQALLWNLPLWIFTLVILLTALYVVSLLKRITVAIEKIAGGRSQE